MRTIILALVSCALLTISQGAPAVKRKEDDKRCCQPSQDCLNPCPPAAPDFSFMPPPPPLPPVDPCCQPGPACSNPCPAAPQLPPLPPQPPVDPCCQPGPACSNPCPAAPQLPPLPPPPPVDPCCQPGPTCSNPCPAPPLPPPPPPPQVPLPPPTDCCAPGPSCTDPCSVPPPLPPMGGFDMGLGGGCCNPMMAQPCANPCPPPAPAPASYAPYPGEITMKLMQNWDPDKFLDHMSPAFQILAGNLKKAVQAALAPRGMPVSVTNVYFREGNVPGNPPSLPKTVAHFMVNQNSDAASLLEAAVTPDGTLGDGLKVYKDSFNAY